MIPKPGTHNAKLLAILSDGAPHSTSSILRRAPMIVHSRVAELRKHGYRIGHYTVPGRKGAHGHVYQWTDDESVRRQWSPAPFSFGHSDKLGEVTATPVAQWKEIAPRNEAERFRIYRLDDGEPELLATVATESAVGVAICTLAREGEFKGNCVGLLDTHGTDEKPGTWIINPFDQR